MRKILMSLLMLAVLAAGSYYAGGRELLEVLSR